jgi:hypothetical protein
MTSCSAVSTAWSQLPLGRDQNAVSHYWGRGGGGGPSRARPTHGGPLPYSTHLHRRPHLHYSDRAPATALSDACARRYVLRGGGGEPPAAGVAAEGGPLGTADARLRSNSRDTSATSSWCARGPGKGQLWIQARVEWHTRQGRWAQRLPTAGHQRCGGGWGGWGGGVGVGWGMMTHITTGILGHTRTAGYSGVTTPRSNVKHDWNDKVEGQQDRFGAGAAHELARAT